MWVARFGPKLPQLAETLLTAQAEEPARSGQSGVWRAGMWFVLGGASVLAALGVSKLF